MGFFSGVWDGIKSIPGGIKHGFEDATNYLGLNGASADTKAQIGHLNDVGAGAQGFAGTAQQNYADLTGRLTGSLNDLQALANGQNSVSAIQLKQAQARNLAQQRAMAASATPQNAAMAARTAAINSAKLGYGLAGQQAVAGQQERNAAQQAYANLLSQSRSQDLQGTLGGYGTAAQAYGGGVSAYANAPTLGGTLLGGLEGLAGAGAFGKGK